MVKSVTAERCVWVTNNWAKWACEHGQITKIWLSDGCWGETIPMTVKTGYCRGQFECYPGNVRRHFGDSQTEILHRRSGSSTRTGDGHRREGAFTCRSGPTLLGPYRCGAADRRTLERSRRRTGLGSRRRAGRRSCARQNSWPPSRHSLRCQRHHRRNGPADTVQLQGNGGHRSVYGRCGSGSINEGGRSDCFGQGPQY